MSSSYWTVLVPIHSLFLSSHLFHLPHILHFDLPSPQFQTTLPLSLFPSPLFNSPALPSLPPPLNSVYLQSFCSLIFLTHSIPSSILIFPTSFTNFFLNLPSLHSIDNPQSSIPSDPLPSSVKTSYLSSLSFYFHFLLCL